MLDESFFQNPSIGEFYRKTISNGFVQWFREYRFGPVMAKGSTRLTHMNNIKLGKEAIIYSACEPHLAKLPVPFKAPDLLNVMLEQHKKITHNYEIEIGLKDTYENNCRKLLAQIENGLSASD